MVLPAKRYIKDLDTGKKAANANAVHASQFAFAAPPPHFKSRSLACDLLPNHEPDKSTNGDVLSKFLVLVGDELCDCLIGVLDERLL